MSRSNRTLQVSCGVGFLLFQKFNLNSFSSILLAIILAHAFGIAVGQTVGTSTEAKETRLSINCLNKSLRREFSALAAWDSADKILLIPQRPGERYVNGTYVKDTRIKLLTINRKDIRKALNSGSHNINEVSEIELLNFDACKRGGYDGIEAAVVVGNTIYFSLESKEDKPCYVVMGVLDRRKNTIVMKEQMVAIPKPANSIDNAGYESLIYWPAKGQLLAFFEKNHRDSEACLIDLSLKNTNVMKFSKTLYFRLTDAHWYKGDTVIAINHHYSKSERENNYYVGLNNKAKASRQMAGRDPQKFSYTALIKIFPIFSNGVEWLTEKIISFTDDNWEGLLPFDNGVLMVFDDNPSDISRNSYCYISYFAIK